jgi:toxin HigB-1
MKIRSIRNRHLRRFIEDDDPRGLRSDLVNRVRNILAALMVADDMDRVRGPPGRRTHQLLGEQEGVWSIAASGNWRITFDIVDGEICNLDLEDDH